MFVNITEKPPWGSVIKAITILLLLLTITITIVKQSHCSTSARGILNNVCGPFLQSENSLK